MHTEAKSGRVTQPTNVQIVCCASGYADRMAGAGDSRHRLTHSIDYVRGLGAVNLSFRESSVEVLADSDQHFAHLGGRKRTESLDRVFDRIGFFVFFFPDGFFCFGEHGDQFIA